MDNQEYGELLKKLKIFYQEKAAPILKQYENERKEDFVPYMTSYVCSIGVLISIFLALFIPVFVILVIGFSMYLYLDMIYTKNKKIKIIRKNNEVVYTSEIPNDYEMILKTKLMPDFLKIFDKNIQWQKYSQTFLYLIEKLSINIEKYLYMTDDVIYSDTLVPRIKIIELTFNIRSYIIPKIVLALELSFKLFILILITIFVRSFISNYNAPSVVIDIIFMLLPFLTVPIIIIYTLIRIFINVRKSKRICVVFDINKKFYSHTVVIDKKDKLKKSKENLEKVILEDVIFEQKYNTFSNNQIEARYLLTTGFMARFEDLKMAFKAKKIRAEFVNKKLYLLIDVDKDLFQMGKITKETNFSTFKVMLDEIFSVLSLSEQLNLDSQTKI